MRLGLFLVISIEILAFKCLIETFIRILRFPWIFFPALESKLKVQPKYGNVRIL